MPKIGDKVYVIASQWTMFDGYYKEPVVRTTLIKARRTMKAQIREFCQEWEIPFKSADISFDNLGYGGAECDESQLCTWTIYEAELK